jgi:2-hydroxychromene-2-carboxylate isomerase
MLVGDDAGDGPLPAPGNRKDKYMTTVEFYFDLSSPWTCLAFHNIQPIIKENNAAIIWKPFLVGGVFNAVNQDVYAARKIPTIANSSTVFACSRTGRRWPACQ